MKSRKVMVTIEMETAWTLKGIKQICKEYLNSTEMKVVQINATVQQPVKGKQ